MKQHPLAAVGLLSFTYFVTLGLFGPYAALWFQSLGFSTLVIGGIASVQAWTRVVAPYGWCWAADHSGRRVGLIRLASAGAFVSALGLLGVDGAVPVALVTACLFVANSGVVPLYEALLARLLHTQQGTDAARYGRIRMWGSVGFIVSVVGFGVLLQKLGVGVFPLAVAAMNGLLLVAALLLPAHRELAASSGPAPAVVHALRRPDVQWFFASVFFTVLAHTGLGVFLSLYLDSLGHGKVTIAAMWALAVVSEIAFFWFQGQVFLRWSPHGWLIVAALASTLRFGATAAAGHWLLVLAVAQAMHGVTFAAHHAACITLVNRFFPGRLLGRGQALYTTLGYGLSGVLGGLGGGWIIEIAGFEGVFWASTLAALAGLVCAARAQSTARAQGPAAA